MLPDCHLVRTAIPFPSRQDSLGVFHPSPSVPLASFAERVSAGDHGGILAGMPAAWFLHPPAPRKAGYICTQRYSPAGPMHRAAGSSAASYAARNTTLGVRPRTRTGLHGNRVVITMPLESALSPQAQAKPGFPPAPTRNWAYQAGTRGFIGVPFRGFLAPPSETDDLTRILRRRLAHISIAWLAKICNSFRIYTERLTVCFVDPTSDFWRHLNSFPGPGPSCRLRCVRGRWSFSKQTTGRSSLPAA